MPGMYSMKDLLKLIADQGAAELRLEPDRPPAMLLHGKVRVLDGPLVTSDHINELFRSIATDEQRRELDLCGNTRFKYTAEYSAQFTVRADMHGESLTLSLKNLES